MQASAITAPYRLTQQPRSSGPFRVCVSGVIALDSAGPFMADMEQLLGRAPGPEMVLDLGGVEYMDSAGALALLKTREKAASRAIRLGLSGLSGAAGRVLEVVEHAHTRAGEQVEGRAARSLLVRVENALSRITDRIDLICLFTGDVAASLAASLIRPHSVRWDAVLACMKKTGVDGLPIVGLISLLLGMIMAFMASLQLRQFGADLYVASLVAIALVKELGPIMTAILFAGRSGSAFSAEIGTMLVNEEIAALSTMGFDPVRFLVVPKVIASIIVVPILTLYADLLGILGGLFVGIAGMDLTFHSYMQQTMESIDTFDVVSSLFKAMCFAVMIAGISCHRGFHARGGAEAVGSATTSAVVSSIFLIIIADSAFAIMLHYIG